MNKKSMVLKAAGVVLSLGLLSGCATTEQLKQMQADIANAQRTADSALAAANGAEADAKKAEGMAVEALGEALKAKQAAEACTEKCGRMMQKAMAK